MPRAKRRRTRLTDAEYRRRQLQESRRQARKRRRRIIYAGVAGFVGLLVILGFVLPQLLQSNPNQTPTQVPGFETEMMESVPIAEGAEHDPYVTTPPTSGPYYDEPAEWGIHDEELPDERVVRNLHLTGVAINYNLVESEQVEQMKEFVKGQLDYPCYLLLQPYSKMPEGTVAMSAWGRLDTIDGIDEERMQDFISWFRGSDRGGVLEKPACSPDGA
jgi:hypothetical protein